MPFLRAYRTFGVLTRNVGRSLMNKQSRRNWIPAKHQKNIKKQKKLRSGTVLPFALAVAAAFVALQLEISDSATASYMAGQWPVYAPLNALTAFCLATAGGVCLCGSWGIATGVSGLIFTVLALVNCYADMVPP